jgi:AraC-like DNA-binding protein/mannose-6-phosphate isomerase-like protein (cupin superfamily)
LSPACIRVLVPFFRNWAKMQRTKFKSALPSLDLAPIVAPGAASKLDHFTHTRLEEIERGEGPVLALPSEYPDGYNVLPHRHTRAQLLYARTGVVMVATQDGRWMVPPDHALWLPAGTVHAVEMLGGVVMNSVYVAPNAIAGLPDHVRVVGLTGLMQNLIAAAVTRPLGLIPSRRAELIMALMLEEIPLLPAKPLGLPFPGEPRLAALCRKFVEAPNPHLTIDAWAEELAMSRRAFTRAFREATGLSLSIWRQQACLFTAVPRLAGGETVTSVALDLGYDSVAAFTTMFTRMLGAPPRVYLRETPQSP